VNTLLLAPELFASDGGIARILRLYLKALCELAEDGDCVRFVALNDSPADPAALRRYSNERLVGWRACCRSKLTFAGATLKMGMSADRIICGHIAQLPLAWVLSRIRPKLKYYLVAHGIEVWRPYSFFELLALKGASRIYCVSEFTRKQMLARCTVPSGKFAVLYNALDPYLNPESVVPPAKEPPVVLSISRLSIADGYKGIDHLIAALPQVRSSVSSARLRIVGRGDGMPGLQALARELRVEDCVEFAGFVSDSELEGEFDGCRLFALPSEKEGFGLVYLEAMAHGRPCLGAHSGGVPEVITDETGVLVEYGDVPGIASAIIAALRREWNIVSLLERVRLFSFPRFKEQLATLLRA
jgi:phosphatidylinositol alpha-1,6-mannosyltransferase